MIKHLDLFSGIGGFSLAAKWTGNIETIGFSEIDKYASAVLAKNFPNIKNYGDIRNITKDTIKERIDLITGGFPCQPFSCAGNRNGTSDSRHLWPEMLRVIKEFRPTWVLGENVAGILSVVDYGEIFDLDGKAVIEMEEGKIAMHEGPGVGQSILDGLGDLGYAVRMLVIPACAVGAMHRRDRVWIVAYSQHNGQLASEIRQGMGEGNDGNTPRANTSQQSSGCFSSEPLLHTNSNGLQGGECGMQETSERETEQALLSTPRRFLAQDWNELPTPHICRGSDGIPNRTHRIKCLGNSIVPQVAYEIMQYMKI